MPHGGTKSLEGALEQLYQAPLGDFTKKRDALAKDLRAAGDDEAAQSLRARRKPTQMAWVLNQLSRQHPDAIAELVDVGRELAREQRKALRGEATGAFRESIARQREVVAALTRTTATLMTELGIDPSGHLDEVSSALLAGLVDPAVGAELEEGRLEKVPHAATGLAEAGLEGALAASTSASQSKKTPAARRSTRRAGPTKKLRSNAKDTRARERREERAAAIAAKKAAEKERAERASWARDAKRAVAAARTALRAAETAAKKKRLAAEKADADARARIEHARALAVEADASARAVEEAQRKLVRAIAKAP